MPRALVRLGRRTVPAASLSLVQGWRTAENPRGSYHIGDRYEGGEAEDAGDRGVHQLRASGEPVVPRRPGGAQQASDAVKRYGVIALCVGLAIIVLNAILFAAVFSARTCSVGASC